VHFRKLLLLGCKGVVIDKGDWYRIIIIIIIIIIMKSSFNRDNNYCHYVIQRIAGFVITLYYHPAGQLVSKYINMFRADKC
jgi:hypothetical protein